MRLVPALLVFLQFAALASLALTGWGGGLSAGAWLPLLAGGALGIAALAVNRPGNFNVRPVPKPGATLVMSGPYRYIRHPMYAALLLAALAAVVNMPGGVTIGLWIVLAAVLGAKAVAEEGALAAADPAYRAYMSRTARFIPGVF